MDSEEVDFDSAKPTTPQVVVNFFKGAGPGDMDPHDVGKLEYKELTPDLLNEYYSVTEKMRQMEDIKEMLRANILKLMGRAESHTAGKFACFVKSETRKGNVDYKALLKDNEITEEVIAQYRKPDTSYQKLEVKKLG